MSSSEIAAPASSAPTDRLALGVGWVRPGVAGIGGTLNPSGTPIVWFQGMCFEGSEEGHPCPPLGGVFNPLLLALGRCWLGASFFVERFRKLCETLGE